MRRLVLSTFLLLLAVGCGGDDHAPTSPSSPVIGDIVVFSPIDTLIAKSRTLQLAAVALDADADTIVTEFLWHSSDTEVATVTPEGLVRPRSVDQVSISAHAGSTSASLGLGIVDADIDGISQTLQDPFTNALVTNLNDPPQATVEQALDWSISAVSSGNLVQVQAGLEDILAEIGTASDPDDTVLLAVLALMIEHAEQLLNIP